MRKRCVGDVEKDGVSNWLSRHLRGGEQSAFKNAFNTENLLPCPNDNAVLRQWFWDDRAESNSWFNFDVFLGFLLAFFWILFGFWFGNFYGAKCCFQQKLHHSFHLPQGLRFLFHNYEHPFEKWWQRFRQDSKLALKHYFRV